ncbi:MAG TPA: F0F1 ATP synthase subunit epsilon [Gammaproteobacteria bacterium]|jgi:F-type H+-transporting ATPase subunit epsilon|nr:F0F1 ATP synthase subunit epsilon [Gammaproteobacteria bacterium]
MKPDVFRLDIVSAEKKIFSGEIAMVFVTGEEGELGIAPGHSQLLTRLKPGYVRLVSTNQEENVFYISGGLLEVQPYIVSVLADSAMRADDLDEEKALRAQEEAQKILSGKATRIDVARAMAELAEAAAQIQVARRFKRFKKQ